MEQCQNWPACRSFAESVFHRDPALRTKLSVDVTSPVAQNEKGYHPDPNCEVRGNQIEWEPICALVDEVTESCGTVRSRKAATPK